jgi:HAD superfamily hydrolase (TIGR01509 family)
MAFAAIMGWMIRHLIWDVDGTLVDTYPAMTRAFTHALAEFGHIADGSQISAWLHVSLEHCAASLSNQFGLSIEELMERFASAYRQIPPADQTPFPGVREVCAYIVESGGLNLIVTHRARASLLALLEAHALAPLFADCVANDDGFPRKPDPAGFMAIMARNHIEPSQTLGIGDREIDVQAAHAAGLRACLFGEPSTQTSADFVISDYAQLMDLLHKEKPAAQNLP